MADTKLTDLTALTAVAAGDFFYVVDISDTTDDAAGSSKKITQANLVAAIANTFTVGQTIAPTATTGSPAPALLVTGAAHTALTASTENIGVNLNLSATKQFAAGALTTQREVVIQAPTYSAVGASTITNATTLEVTGPPTAGTNVTITNANAARFTGKVVIGQPGGTVGTDEGQLSHDGSKFLIENKDGGMQFTLPYGTAWTFSGGGDNDVSCSFMTSTRGIRDVNFNTYWKSNRITFKRSSGVSVLEVSPSSDAFLTSPDVGLYSPDPGVFTITNGTAGRWGQLKLGTYDSGTTSVTDGLTVGHRSSGTPAAGLGSAILFNIDSSTTADQAAGRLSFSWATATHAIRKARATLSVYDTAEREGMRVEADGSNPMVGFLGATAVVRQTSGADLTNNVTSGGSDDTIADYSDLVVYANDAAAIRNDIYQLARKLKQVNDALRAFGLLT